MVELTAGASDGGAAVVVDEPAPGVRRARMRRPSKRNAIDGGMLDGLLRSLDDPPPAVVLAGAGRTAFCAGMDLGVGQEERGDLSDRLYGLYERMVRSSAIIIAALAGPAVGGGAQLAIASDLRVAHPEAWLRFPGVGHGLSVGAWGLPSLVGRGRALRVCATMERIPAATAHAWGLVDAIEDDPEAAAVALAAGLAQQEPAALARVKRVASIATGIEAALAEERRHNLAMWDGSVAPFER